MRPRLKAPPPLLARRRENTAPPAPFGAGPSGRAPARPCPHVAGPSLSGPALHRSHRPTPIPRTYPPNPLPMLPAPPHKDGVHGRGNALGLMQSRSLTLLRQGACWRAEDSPLPGPRAPASTGGQGSTPDGVPRRGAAWGGACPHLTRSRGKARKEADEGEFRL